MSETKRHNSNSDPPQVANSNQNSQSRTVGSSSRRPTVRPPSPTPTNSGSSILTLSNLYQHQQRFGTIPSKQSNSGIYSKTKRAFSASSMSDFLKSGHSSASNSPTGEHIGSTRSLPGAKLPTFQKMDSTNNSHNPEEPETPEFSPNLTSSKIYGRRKSHQESKHNVDVDIPSGRIDEEIYEALDEEDEVVKKNYEKKKKNMASKRAVEFYNSDTASEVDINSEHSKMKNDPVSVSQIEKDKSNTESSEAETPTNNNKGFMGFVKRMTMTDGQYDLPDRVRNRFEENDDHERSFFSKFVNISGGGMIPGASKAEERRRQTDEEAQVENIPLRSMDTQQFALEAQDIIQAHAGTKSKNSVAPIEEDESEDESERPQYRGGHDSFLAPNPDLYIRDEANIFELEGITADANYIPPPERVRGGVLSTLLRLYQNPEEASKSRVTLVNSEASSAVTTPAANTPTEERDEYFTAKAGSSIADRLRNITGKKKAVQIDDENVSAHQSRIHEHRKHQSLGDFSPFKDRLSGDSRKASSSSQSNLPSFSKNRPKGKRASALIKKQREQAQARITVHIAGILQVQRFILRMCKALMLYGAPTHRLEEYLTMTARVLEVDAQFIYLPGCMIISFGDATTRTSEVQLVRVSQGLNLYKLHKVHRIYKKVIHDLIGVEDASKELDDLLGEKPQYPPYICVLIYALASAMVTPFAFGGGWVNLPVSFCIGGCVGFLQFYLAPKSNLYLNVFEVTASIVVSFIGRALGSIEGSHICFSAVTQGSLALILPGYIILCGSLELQSKSLVAGSVRMFYAIIYSLFLGFGITLGAAMYGWIDSNATSETTCSESISDWWHFLFVPMFTLMLSLINQARWFQLPIMLSIACAGYIVNYFASKHFSNSTEFTSAIGAFVIGVLGNLYSRVWKGLAVSAMLPAIFVQVPSGIASQGSLLAGVENANRLVSNSTSSDLSNSASGLSFGVTMVQVAIGISVGLFASTIAVYPFGKKSTSVFTL